MSHLARLVTVVAAAVLTLLVARPAPVEAQFIKKLKRTAQNAAESEVLRKVDQTVRASVRCALDDPACINAAKERGDEVVLVDEGGQVVDEKTAEQRAALKPGEGAWANYDFVPGDTVLFADDFSTDNIGDFPRRFELIEGNFELVDWQGVRLLRATADGSFRITLPEVLPERFTIEFDAMLKHGNSWIRVTSAPYYFGPNRGAYAGSAIDLRAVRAGLFPIKDQGPKIETQIGGNRMTETLVPVRIMADGDYMKVYIGEKRVVNAPNAVFPRTNTLYVGFDWALEDEPLFIGPIRVAAGGRDLYDRLARDGRVATQGIYFSTSSDRLRPESTPTLTAIATMLTEHPTLTLRIEGHTDATGDEATNQALSARRAASVREWLVESAGIAPGRLTAAGLGESKPVGSNDTPEGRQQNRRVELVRVEG
ncbi:MAG TPA: OmpA family protein [Gemmatimonadales bacterium]|nr:OmpA family protein [Gemmatimonadales bacterium]